MRGRQALVAVAVMASWACGGDDGPTLSREELLDPEACADCHPIQHQEWLGSMHAYAGDDPVFLAMNRRGQEETDGELGDFCVKCHAPMALAEGATTDGLNLDEVPQHLKGITCYFCHNVEAVEGTHNNPLRLANDSILRGSLEDTINAGHRTGYSALLDSNRFESSDMCGACHDIVTPAGVHLERTYTEYLDSVFSKPFGVVQTSCSTCHMFTETGRIADVDGAPGRRRHSHAFPGVDVALTDWPGKDEQLLQIQRDLDAVVKARLCVNPAAGGVGVDIILDNVNGGHKWPSGASADRRAWVRLEAFEGASRVFVSGEVAADQAVVAAAENDSNLWQIRDFTFKEGGTEEAHMFWDVRTIDEQTLPYGTTNDPTDPAFIHSVEKSYSLVGVSPDRISMQVSIRPVGYDILDDLIDSGHLGAGIKELIPTFDLASTSLEWTSDRGFGCVPN